MPRRSIVPSSPPASSAPSTRQSTWQSSAPPRADTFGSQSTAVTSPADGDGGSPPPPKRRRTAPDPSAGRQLAPRTSSPARPSRPGGIPAHPGVDALREQAQRQLDAIHDEGSFFSAVQAVARLPGAGDRRALLDQLISIAQSAVQRDANAFQPGQVDRFYDVIERLANEPDRAALQARFAEMPAADARTLIQSLALSERRLDVVHPPCGR